MGKKLQMSFSDQFKILSKALQQKYNTNDTEQAKIEFVKDVLKIPAGQIVVFKKLFGDKDLLTLQEEQNTIDITSNNERPLISWFKTEEDTDVED